MASNRYRTIIAILDDPLNRLAVARELLRRGPVKVLPPPAPLKSDDGETVGWVFLTLRQVMREGLTLSYSVHQVSDLDCVVHIFTDGEGQWFVTLINEGGMEVGPFDSSGDALKEARSWLEGEGNLLLGEVPWDVDDTATFLLKSKRP